ncbi:tetratricopeptide repeat protein [Acidobacteriota bacterium]
MFKKIFFVSFILVFVFVLTSQPQVSSRRVKLMVVNSENQPLEKVKITMTSPDRSGFRKEYQTNKKGESGFIIPMEIKNANFLLEKEGYQEFQQTVDLRTMRVSQAALKYEGTFTLYRSDQLSPQQEAQNKEVYDEALPLFNAGIEFFQAEQFLEAADQFEKALVIKSDFFEALENLAVSYFRAEQFAKAIEAAKRALELKPDYSQLLKMISVSYSALGDEASASEYLEKMKSLPDAQFSPEELFNMAVTAANQGKDQEAKAYFERSVELKPDFALGHFQLGMCYFRLQDFDGAKKELGKYLELDPDGEQAQVAMSILEHISKR